MEQLFLVVRRTPAAIDEELDAVVRGMGCSLAQGTEQIGVEVGYTRNLVIEDRRAVGDGTVSRGRGRQRLVAEDCRDRRDDDQQAGYRFLHRAAVRADCLEATVVGGRYSGLRARMMAEPACA
jgi:hypothetical protein